jgi:hypothetical protein
MGPKRDLTGDLAKAVRKENLICGLSSHRMERDAFAFPGRGVPNDQFDPRYADFYGQPIQGTFNNSNASPHARRTSWPASRNLSTSVAKDALYAIGCLWPRREARLTSLSIGRARVKRATLPRSSARMKSKQTADTLVVSLP